VAGRASGLKKSCATIKRFSSGRSIGRKPKGIQVHLENSHKNRDG